MIYTERILASEKNCTSDLLIESPKVENGKT